MPTSNFPLVLFAPIGLSPLQERSQYRVRCHLVTTCEGFNTWCGLGTRSTLGAVDQLFNTCVICVTCSSSVGGRLEQDEIQGYWGYRGAFRSGKRQDMQRIEWRKSEPYKERHALYRRWIVIRSSAGWTQHFCILLDYQKASKYIKESVSK